MAGSSAIGSLTMNVVPWPGRERTLMSPDAAVTMR
jgi:hypothetical protein